MKCLIKPEDEQGIVGKSVVRYLLQVQATVETSSKKISVCYTEIFLLASTTYYKINYVYSRRF